MADKSLVRKMQAVGAKTIAASGSEKSLISKRVKGGRDQAARAAVIMSVIKSLNESELEVLIVSAKRFASEKGKFDDEFKKTDAKVAGEYRTKAPWITMQKQYASLKPILTKIWELDENVSWGSIIYACAAAHRIFNEEDLTVKAAPSYGPFWHSKGFHMMLKSEDSLRVWIGLWQELDLGEDAITESQFLFSPALIFQAYDIRQSGHKCENMALVLYCMRVVIETTEAAPVDDLVKFVDQYYTAWKVVSKAVRDKNKKYLGKAAGGQKTWELAEVEKRHLAKALSAKDFTAFYPKGK